MAELKVRLRVDKILIEKNISKYALQKMIDMDYDNMNKMIRNRTTSIRYATLGKLCKALNCNVGDLFEIYYEEDDQ